MPESGLENLLAVALVAFAAPLLLGLVPALRVPAVVAELVAGIALGPSGLGLIEPDEPVRVLALVGLAFLLFLAGLEVDVTRLRGRALRGAATGLGLSAALAALAGGLLATSGLVSSGPLVAVALLATSLGIVVPVLRDAGRAATAFGAAVFTAASLADIPAVLALSLLFSRDASTPGARVFLLGAFAAAVAVAALVLAGGRRLRVLSAVLVRLQDTTAQIRVRGAFALLIGLAAVAGALGLEAILGAFLAGVVLRSLDRDEQMTHPRFHGKLEAVGFGVFVPVFFVASGLAFDLEALTASPAALAAVPVFLAALLAVRGLPAVVVLRGAATGRETAAAALLQATSLPFIVAAVGAGRELGLIDAADAAGLVAAGLVSVVLFPALALVLLRRRSSDTVPPVTCQEFVELVTEYLDGALPPSERARFEAHIEHCDGCRMYIDQFRETIAAVGHLSEGDIDPAAEARLLEAFRSWKTGG